MICLVTGLALAASGVLGMTDGSGELVTGSALTIAAFSTTFGNWGGYLVSIGIALFAFATIIAWEYQGEKAFEFLVKKAEVLYCLSVFVCAGGVSGGYLRAGCGVGLFRHYECTDGSPEPDLCLTAVKTVTDEIMKHQQRIK